jgi:hypothetical protein
MAESFAEIKLNALRKRIEGLHEQFMAANDQLNRMLDDSLRVRLRRTVAHLETEIRSLEAELVAHVAQYPELQVETPVTQRLQILQQLVAELTHLSEAIVLRLQLSITKEEQLEIRGLDVPGKGRPKIVRTLPYTEAQRAAILKALDVGEYVTARFHEHAQALTELGILKQERFVQNFHERIGVTLYQTLFQAAIGVELEIARRSGKTVFCQLELDFEDAQLAQYPWELLHDGSAFLIPMRNGLELVRYISFPDPPTPLVTRLPLRVLFISPRPKGETELVSQAAAIRTGLQTLQEAGQVRWEQLNPPTWAALEKRLYQETFDIIHFDGHGAYARICPDCGLAHAPNAQVCNDENCEADLQQVKPQGYLHFERTDGALDAVKVADIKQVFAKSDTRLIFLSACGSGVVEGVSVFNGVAPALIQIGVPAVVAMQAAPPDPSSLKFVTRFYESLAQGKRIPTAVNDGRLAIFRPEAGEPIAWFMPVVYLRSADQTYGQLFQIS